MKIRNGDLTRKIYFVAVDSADLKTRETGLSSFTVQYSVNGAAEVAVTTPTVSEIDATNMPGVYALDIDEAGMVALAAGEDFAEVALHITQASMAPVTRVYDIERRMIQNGMGRGTVTTGGSTTSVPTSAFSPAGGVADQFKGRVIVFDNDTTTAALRGQAAVISASSNSATPTFTVSTLTTAPASGDTFAVI